MPGSLIGESVRLEIIQSTFAGGMFVTNTLLDETFIVGAGIEINSQNITFSEESSGFNFNTTLAVVADVGADTFFAQFTGAPNSGSNLQWRFSSISDESIASVTGVVSTATVNPMNLAGINIPSGFGDTVSIYLSPLGSTGGASYTASQTVTATFSVSSGNSAPLLGGTPADDTAVEDVATAIDLSAYNVSDADGDTITLTLAVNRGSIASVDGNVTVAGVTVAGSGSASMTLSGSAASLNTYLNNTSKITFLTSLNDTTSATLTVTPNDGTVNGTADIVTINITPVNDAPALFTAFAPLLTGITEDAGDDDGSGADGDDDATNNANNGGTTVASIVIDGTITDPDGAVEAIAVTAVDNTNGIWQFKTGAGPWTDFSATTGSPVFISSNARLLDSTDLIRFVPNANFNGTSTISFRAWDKSSGTAGGTADPGSGGGSSAFSSAFDTATITVSAVNDAPTIFVGTGNLVSTNEDTTSFGTIVSTLLADRNFADVDIGNAQGIAVTGVAANGTWEYSANGVTGWTAFGPVSPGSSLLLPSTAAVRYVPDGVDGETATFSWRGWDQTSSSASFAKTSTTATGGETAFSANSATASVAVTAINDEPTLTATGIDPNHQPGTGSDLFSTVTADTIETGQTFSSLTLTVSGLADGADETLGIDGSTVALTDGASITTATNALSVSVSVSGTTATATFTGAALSEAQLQTLVDGLSYNNTSATPTLGNRVVTITEVVDSGSNTAPNDNTATLSLASTIAVVETPSLVVTTTADVVDVLDGETSLREAIEFSNTDGNSNLVITFAGGAGEAFEGGGTAFVDAPLPDILRGTGSLTIDGAGTVVIDGSFSADPFAAVPEPFHTFAVDAASGAGVVAFDGLTIEKANQAIRQLGGVVEIIDSIFDDNGINQDGGAIAVFGGVTTITDSTFSDNNSGGSFNGGAIRFSGSTLDIIGSTFVDNVASNSGGAIIGSGAITITDSTFSGNTSEFGFGGAINVGSGSLLITGSTFVGNYAGTSVLANGGAILASFTDIDIINSTFVNNGASGPNGSAILANFGTVDLTNVTVTGHTSGAALHSDSATTTMTNSLISGNTGGDNAAGVNAFTDTASNVIGGTPAAIFAAIEGTTGGGVLADNGGPVQTVALRADASNPALDVGLNPLMLLLDANGNDRALDLPGVGNDGMGFVDAGAVEMQALGDLSVSISPASIQESGGTATGTVTRSGDTSTALVVTLSSSDTTEATVPGTVTILAGNASATFAVTAVDDGVIDGDQPVTITATGAAINPGTGSLTVIENRPPTITLDPATLTLPEDTDVTSRVKVADVVIADDGIGTNLLTMRGPDAGAFELIGTELFVKAGARLDFELENELNIFVDVNDPTLGGPRDDTEAFTLTLTDVNEAPGVALTNVVSSLPEDTDTSARIKVADIVVTDDALGAETLALSGADASKFEIDGTVLYLKAGTTLDFESDPGFDVTVEVDDISVGATPDDTASLSLAVTDVNEPPSVSLVNVAAGVPETPFLSGRIKVADIVITDDALGSETLSLSGADRLAFQIDGLELYLKAGRGFDFETMPALSVSVDVNDAAIPGAPDGSAALVFPILDVNEAPSLALANVLAGLPEDTDTSTRVKIADIVVTDDALGTNTLALTGADAGLFEIDGAELFLKAGTALDFESDPQLDVTVTLDDPGFAGLEGSAPVVLAVSDVNEPPMVALANEVTDLSEDTDTTTRIKVADIVITDDALGTNTLGLTGADAGLFKIDGLELFLIAGAALDFETNPALDVTVTISNPEPDGTPDDTTDLTIAIGDVNEAPSLALENVVSDLAEDTDTSTRVKVADVVVTDDALGTNMLGLTGADAGLFEIDGTELFLKAGTALDFESDPQLDVTVTLDDAAFAGLEGSEAVALSITDENELPTVALLNALAGIAEDTDTSTRVKVADIDITDDALGSTTLGLAGADAALFEIDGTELFLKAGTALDFESDAALDVVVTVDDPALGTGPDDSDALALAVTDVNEAPSLALANLLAGLPENTDTTIRVKVADIVVTDDALGLNTLGLTGADAALFEIEGTELFLKAGTTLDFETVPQFDVTVTLDDPDFAGLEGSEDVALAITNTNEPPVVALSNVVSSLAEDTDTTTRIKIADIDVTDDGLGSQTLGLAGADAALFEIDGTELFVKAGTLLDFEIAAALDVTVTINDPSLAPDPDDSAALTVAVTDVNEAPSLDVTQDVTALTDDTDTSARLAVASLAVLDDALGSNTITLSGDDAALFEVDGGTLYLKAGVVLDGGSNPVLDVTIDLDDATLGAGPEDSVALMIEVADTDQTGTLGNDLLIGTPFVDGLFGLEGDDTLVGREGDDVLDGGAGEGDVAVFQAPQTSYTITLSPGGTTVADRTPGGTGTDTVIDIETLRFSSDPVGAPGTGDDLDLTLFEGVLDFTAAQLASVTHLYIGLYNRAPDALGLFYWATQLAEGLGLHEITQYFIDSPEAIALYGAAPTNAEIVEKAYENLLDRASDTGGASFWTALLNLDIITPATFFELFVQGAARNPSAGDDRTTLADQKDIALYYAVIQGLSDTTIATTALGTYDVTDRASSLMDAQDLIDSYAATAMGTGATGELIVQVLGVIDDPFA